MRATGIVRKIDELGRLVLPKEIRRTLQMREGDPLEIYTDREGNVILRKYSPIVEMKTFAQKYVETLSQIINHSVLIIDRDTIVASAGGVKKEMIGKSISHQMGDAIKNRERIIAVKGDNRYVNITDSGLDEYGSQVIYPILSDSEIIGAIVLLGKDSKISMDETKQALVQFAVSFLGLLTES
ncbi:MAG: stage V sporulation T C-terminal domain-containing protein [Lachnospiraceae bacterium]